MTQPKKNRARLAHDNPDHISKLRVLFGIAVLSASSLQVFKLSAQPTNNDPAIMRSVEGVWEGGSREPSSIFLNRYAGLSFCELITSSVDYELSLSVDPSSNEGTAEMTVSAEFEAKYDDMYPTSDKQKTCYRDAIGNSNSSSGSHTITYEGTWKMVPYNRRRIVLNLRATDCSGDRCGRLGSISREVEIYASGYLVYQPPNSTPIRLNRR